jgi:hypothetical protein
MIDETHLNPFPSMERRKPGPVARLENARNVTIVLEDDLIEWGKRQPDGLSHLVRAMLREAKSRSDS